MEEGGREGGVGRDGGGGRSKCVRWRTHSGENEQGREMGERTKEGRGARRPQEERRRHRGASGCDFGAERFSTRNASSALESFE